MPESVGRHHLLLIGAGPGVGAGVVRRFGREGFRSTLISRGETLEQLATDLRSGELEIEAVAADIEDLDSYRATLEQIFNAPGAPGVSVYNAALPDPGAILDTTVERLRTAYDVDVLGAVIAAQVAAPVLRAAGGGTMLVTSGGFADHPVPALASLSMGKSALRSAQTLIAPAYGKTASTPRPSRSPAPSSRGRTSIRTRSQSFSGPLTPTHRTPGRPSIGSPAHSGRTKDRRVPSIEPALSGRTFWAGRRSLL